MTVITTKWQQIIDNRGLAIAVVEIGDLFLDKRLDAEFYNPQHLLLLSAIRNKGFSLLEDIAFITDGEHGSPCWDENSNIKYITAENIGDNFINESSGFRTISEQQNKRNLRAEVRESDILLYSVGVNLGLAAKAEKHLLPASIPRSVALLRLLNDEIQPGFISTFLNSKYGKFQTERLKAGNAQPMLALEKIKKIEIPLPSSQFELQIAELVENAKKYRLESKYLYTEAEQLLLSELNLQDWTFNEANTAIKSSEEVNLYGRVDAEFFQPKYDELEEKIRSYSGGCATLGELMDVKIGLQKIKSDETYRYCELADIDASNGIVSNYSTMLGSELPSRARMKIKQNDVIVSSVGGSSTKVGLVRSDDTNLIASTGFFVLSPLFFLPEVNLLLMKSLPYQELLKRSARGMILAATIKDDFKNYPVPKLKQTTQDSLAAKVQASHNARDRSEKLLKVAKRAVEIYIEEDEFVAENFITTSLRSDVSKERTHETPDKKKKPQSNDDLGLSGGPGES